MKRIVDLVVSFCGLIFFSPLLLSVMFFVWRQDGHSPFYVAARVGQNECLFNMIKLRSMVVDADASGVDSTGSNDMRITAVGHFIRRYKLDELTQLWNVLKGDMSLVGPRPNIQRETDLYTVEEKVLLSVRPGITDFSSIVFSDEGDILEGREDPDLMYNQIIRPWKSRLGLVYVKNQSIILDIKLILWTLIAIVSRNMALKKISELLKGLNVEKNLIRAASRKYKLESFPPPGSNEVVKSR